MPRVGAITVAAYIRNTTTLIDGHVFNTAGATKTSSSIDISRYKDLIILIDLAVTGAPTDILIEVYFSDDDTTFYKLMEGPFGDLRYEDEAGDKKEALHSKAYASNLKVKATSSGTDATNYFTLTVKVETIN